MKLKTDLYTKIVLTVIAIALVGHLLKDIDLVSKAQANELDLSGMKIENVSDGREITFFIYENDKLDGGFGKDKYSEEYSSTTTVTLLSGQKKTVEQPSFRTADKSIDEAVINQHIDTPKYIITNKTGKFWLSK